MRMSSTVHHRPMAAEPRPLQIIASVKRLYPSTILSTPGISLYRLSYKRVTRAVPHKPLRWSILLYLIEAMHI